MSVCRALGPTRKSHGDGLIAPRASRPCFVIRARHRRCRIPTQRTANASYVLRCFVLSCLRGWSLGMRLAAGISWRSGAACSCPTRTWCTSRTRSNSFTGTRTSRACRT
eukprot:1065088-Prorocentrum_minimum.AAC.1